MFVALTAWRHPGHRGGGRASSNNGVAARCPAAGASASPESVLGDGPVSCGLCGGNFTA
jgi:hypothetical protein